MTDDRPTLAEAGVTAVAIVAEVGVAGRTWFHAACLSCGWKCWRNHPDGDCHVRESTAVRHAREHVCAT